MKFQPQFCPLRLFMRFQNLDRRINNHTLTMRCPYYVWVWFLQEAINICLLNRCGWLIYRNKFGGIDNRPEGEDYNMPQDYVVAKAMVLKEFVCRGRWRSWLVVTSVVVLKRILFVFKWLIFLRLTWLIKKPRIHILLPEYRNSAQHI